MYKRSIKRIMNTTQSSMLFGLIKQNEIGMKQFEHQVREKATQMVNGPQRFRGIAGSGKTRQLCYNAACLHKKNPDWNIAVIFQTQSIYQEIITNIEVGISELEETWNPDKLIAYHAWGSKRHEGFLSHLCKLNGLSLARIRNEVNRKNQRDEFAYLCRHILETYPIKPFFHALFIDEGQDLVYSSPDVLFEKKQPFYYLAYQSLHPVDPANPKNRRLVWAYDEYQNLHTLQIPKITEIFGDNPPHVNSLFMNVCYRTPGCNILAAHAICMGLLNREGMIAGPTQKDAWNALGYQVNGDFRKNGNLIELYRDPDLSRNCFPIKDEIPIQLDVYDNEKQEREGVARRILKNLNEDGLDPSKNILVIDLGSRFQSLGENLHKEYGINVYIPQKKESNEFFGMEQNTLPRKFRDSQSVTVTNVDRAKGNEADIVYILGLHEIARKTNGMDINMRNKLFVAMTRSKGWIHISGTGRYPLYEEIALVLTMLKKDPNRLQFHYRTPKFPLNPWDGDPEGEHQTDLDAFFK